jgi:hypothetical protein
MSERILVCLLVVVAILATIPQAMFLPWGIVLVLLGLIAGAMGQSGDAADRTVIYVAAIALPVFSNSLDVIPTVGPWVNQVLDYVATGIQGMAVAIFVVAIYGRLMPGSK